MILLLFYIINFSFFQPQKITKIPRYSSPLVNISLYSSYITTNSTYGRSLYYLLVENENPSAPLIMWLQGGPGCSSLMAFITEHGPFVLNDDGSVVLNEYSIHKFAHVLYVDSPAGIGYGYCKDKKNFLEGGDDRTTNDLYVFLQEFFKNHFPQFQKNEFFVSGESYGGVYVPLISYKIDEENKNDKNIHINLKGLLMGNAVINFPNLYNAMPFWLMSHAIVSPLQYSNGYLACDGEFYYNANRTECKKWLDVYDDQLAWNNVLDLYTPCYGGIRGMLQAMNKKKYSIVGDPAVLCINTKTSYDYFNMEESYDAFHVDPNFKKYTKKWVMCSDEVEGGKNYDTQYDDLIPFINTLIEKGYRTFLVSGDVDACCPYWGNVYDLESIRVIDHKDPSWTKWYTTVPNKQIAGYYKCSKKKEFCFATVKGAGHMIATYKPYESYEAFRRFIQNDWH